MNDSIIENTKVRKLFNFDTIGIPDLFSLGKVDLLKTQDSFPPHIHPDQFEICIHYDGSQYYEIDGVGYETHAGDIFFSFPNEYHSTGNHREEKSRFFYLIFSCPPEAESFIGLEKGASRYIVETLYSVKSRTFPGSMVVRPILEDVVHLYFSDHPLRIPRIYSQMIHFFYELCVLIDQSPEHTPQAQDVLRAKEYIDCHPMEIPTVEALAKMAYLSEPQFKRKFKQHTSFSPHDYILRQKVGLAKEMLFYSDLPITQIAYDLGLSSSQLFAKVFKKYTGLTPSEYRSRVRKEQRSTKE